MINLFAFIKKNLKNENIINSNFDNIFYKN